MKTKSVLKVFFTGSFLFTLLFTFQACNKDTITKPVLPGDEIIIEDWKGFNDLERSEVASIGTLLVRQSEINESIGHKGSWYLFLKNGDQVYFIPEYVDEDSKFTDLADLFVVQELQFTQEEANYGYEFIVRANSPEDLDTGDYKVRAIFIPKNINLDGEVDLTSYQQVKEHFQLED